MCRVCLLAPVDTHTEYMPWLSQTGAGLSCAATEVESESRWSQTMDYYTVGENGHCPPPHTHTQDIHTGTHTLAHSRGYMEIWNLFICQKHMSFFKQITLFFVVFLSLLPNVTVIFISISLCVCLWTKRSDPTEITLTAWTTFAGMNDAWE